MQCEATITSNVRNWQFSRENILIFNSFPSAIQADELSWKPAAVLGARIVKINFFGALYLFAQLKIAMAIIVGSCCAVSVV